MYTIRRFTHNDQELWCLIGKYFASRQIRKELGGPMSSDDTYIWYVAVESGAALGWGAMEAKVTSTWLHHGYILPEYRGRRIWPELIAPRIEEALKRGLPIRGRSTHSIVDAMLRRGFSSRGKVGKYHDIIRVP